MQAIGCICDRSSRGGAANFTRKFAQSIPNIFVLAIAGVLTACATQPGSILNTQNLTENESFLIGARQRAILNNPVGKGSRPGLVNPERVVCAEPSPDVALAVAQSLGFGLSVLGGGGQGALSGTGATSEGVGQLGERTQAIQLLRDQMYRACEAYANGAITGTTYNLIMSKNNDAMVTLMMAGVAGGEFGRAGLAIGGSASSESSASVSKLLETVQAVDEAADELKKAEEKEATAEKNLEASKTVAADTEGKSEEQVEEEKKDVEEAEKEVAAAKEDVKEKQERKNDADSKARAEITKVIGAGSITAKASVGIGQVLEQMQDNFLREDFADEYVSACIVELGLSNAGAPEYVRELARAEAVARAHMFDKFVDENPGAQSKRASAYVDFVQEVGTTERYSLLARHCRERLFDFVIFARNGEIMIEQEKIRLDARRIEQQGDQTRKETLELYRQLIDRCEKIEDPKLQSKCQQSAATIVERPGGILELGEITTIEVPTGKPPQIVIAFEAAIKKRIEFDKQEQKLRETALPTLDATKVSEADAVVLKKSFDSLTEANTKLKQEAAALKQEAARNLTPEARQGLVERQKARTVLLDQVELAANASEEDREIERDRLALHDKISQKVINDLRKFGERLDAMSREIKAHLVSIAELKQKIDAAEAAKASGG